MSKQSSTKYAKSLFLRYLNHHHHHIPKPTQITQKTLKPKWAPHFSTLTSNPSSKVLKETNLNRTYIGFRYISTGSTKNVNSIKDKLKDPVGGVKKAFSRYRQAVGLQMEAFWRRNSMVLLGAGAVFVCVLLWRVMFGIANTFIGFSEGMAKYGFLALSSAIVAFTYDMKLLSVDLPMAAGPDQRLFLIGDEEEYRVGGGLISELRDPVIRAMAAAKEFEARDLKEDKEDEERELEEAERKQREEVEKLERQS
ncbi:hypothetical protein CTI12_AA021310 [Artemisia annua]|uniref:Uncharacterized protein n=1 Tax=Artemisia annua TaxID=35608 RepID=A0A2U1QK14_ARTAN|nr:hypothetical protein CTI12_AA021310 [Artemisia annua]